MSNERSKSSGFIAASNVIARLLADLRPPTEAWLDAIKADWSTVVGTAVAVHTTPDSIEGDTLVVRVANHVWLAELRGGLGIAVLKKLREQICADVQHIRWTM